LNNKDKLLAERYLRLSGIPILEEKEEGQEAETKAVEDAFAGGENLVKSLDHSHAVGGEKVSGHEVLDPVSGEVSQLSEAKIQEIIKKVKEVLSRKTDF